MSAWQPKTGERCHCRRGVERSNCPDCEGTGYKIDFARIRAATARPAPDPEPSRDWRPRCPFCWSSHLAPIYPEHPEDGYKCDICLRIFDRPTFRLT